MATITKKQVIGIDSKCSNGFQLDLQYFVARGEKRLVKIITLIKDVKIIRVSLFWSQQQINEGRKYVFPKLHCSVWDKSSTGCWYGYGEGTFHEFRDNPSNKKSIAELCKVTALATDELISSMLSTADRKEFRKIAGLPEE